MQSFTMLADYNRLMLSFAGIPAILCSDRANADTPTSTPSPPKKNPKDKITHYRAAMPFGNRKFYFRGCFHYQNLENITLLET